MEDTGLKRRVGTGVSLMIAVVALLSLGVLLTSASSNASAAEGLWITRVTPLGGASTPFNRLEIQFSSAVLSDTFTLADVSLRGPGGVITPTALTYLAGDRYELASSGTGLNTYSLVIGPDIRDLSDRQMDQNHNGTAGEPGGKTAFVVPNRASEGQTCAYDIRGPETGPEGVEGRTAQRVVLYRGVEPGESGPQGNALAQEQAGTGIEPPEAHPVFPPARESALVALYDNPV